MYSHKVVLSKSSNVKKFSPGDGYSPPPPNGENIVPTWIKDRCCPTIAIKNNYLENDWIKVIRIRYNCTQFCPIPLR